MKCVYIIRQGDIVLRLHVLFPDTIYNSVDLDSVNYKILF